MSIAADALKNRELVLREIAMPKPREGDLMPPEVPAAAAALALTVQLLDDAERKIETMRLDRIARLKRIAALNAQIAELSDTVIDAWCVTYSTELEGKVVTLEVPGWYQEEGVGKSAVLYADTPEEKVVFYTERSINIGAQGSGPVPTGRLRPSEGMTPAAVYFNTAMEPGHFRWQPLWRYGILTTDGENDVCNLTLNVAADRGREGYEINNPGAPIGPPDRNLIGVPIRYPPCDGAAFAEGDEVVVWFATLDWNQPFVIGFRREPKRCRSNWRERYKGLG